MSRLNTATVPFAGRIEVREAEPGVDERADYSDAYRLDIPAPDGRSAEQWARAGLEHAPAPLRAAIVVAHRRVLGFRLGPLDAPDHVLGWKIVTSTPDLVHLRAESALLRGGLVARRPDEHTAELSTYLYYRRPRAAAAIWTAVGPAHRALAQYLLRRAARV